MDRSNINELRERLLKKDDLIPVVDYFVKKSLEEVKRKEEPTEIPYSEFYSIYMDFISKSNCDHVFRFSRSPIETITVNSLILLFIKNGFIELNITEVCPDFELFSSNYRKAHNNIMSLANEYVSKSGDMHFERFDDFFQNKIDKGYYTKEDYDTFEFHRLIVDKFMWDAYYLTLQAGLPNIVVGKNGITVDMIFWKPSDETFKLVVECDGFKWHSNKKSFENDRKRDRLLKMNGYDVIRFAGAEIYNDPVKVASEIYDYIDNYKTPVPNSAYK